MRPLIFLIATHGATTLSIMTLNIMTLGKAIRMRQSALSDGAIIQFLFLSV
jgi:hypothetical protein